MKKKIFSLISPIYFGIITLYILTSPNEGLAKKSIRFTEEKPCYESLNNFPSLNQLSLGVGPVIEYEGKTRKKSLTRGPRFQSKQNQQSDSNEKEDKLEFVKDYRDCSFCERFFRWLNRRWPKYFYR